MSDLPKSVRINEEGPREGFQIEPGPIPTARKIELIDALSETGLRQIQVASFVNPKRVPGWADADEVVRGFHPREGVRYTALWLNEKGLERALAHRDRLHIVGSISLCASEPFMLRNQQRGFAENAQVQRNQISIFRANGIPVTRMSVMAAFGCNYAGEVPVGQVIATVRSGLPMRLERSRNLSTSIVGSESLTVALSSCESAVAAWPAPMFPTSLSASRWSSLRVSGVVIRPAPSGWSRGSSAAGTAW